MFTLYRRDGVLTFEPSGEPAGRLTAPEGSAVVGNQLIVPGLIGRMTADGARYAAGKGWDGLKFEPLPAAPEGDAAREVR